MLFVERQVVIGWVWLMNGNELDGNEVNGDELDGDELDGNE